MIRSRENPGTPTRGKTVHRHPGWKKDPSPWGLLFGEKIRRSLLLLCPPPAKPVPWQGPASSLPSWKRQGIPTTNQDFPEGVRLRNTSDSSLSRLRCASASCKCSGLGGMPCCRSASTTSRTLRSRNTAISTSDHPLRYRSAMRPFGRSPPSSAPFFCSLFSKGSPRCPNMRPSRDLPPNVASRFFLEKRHENLRIFR